MSQATLHRLALLACLGLTLTPALTRADDAPVTLNLVPLANVRQAQLFTMKMVTDMKVTPRPGATDEEVQAIQAKLGAVKMPLTMTMQMRQELETGKADAKGRIPLTARIEQSKMEMRMGDGSLLPAPSNRSLTDMQFSAELVGGRYENIRLSGEGTTALPAPMLESVFRKTFDALAKLNGTKLRPGETVDLPLDMNLPMPGMVAASNAGLVTARYTLTKVEAGVAYFDITASIDFKLDLPAPPQPASAPAGAEATPAAAPRMTLTGGGTGHLQIRLADRLQVHNDMDMQMNVQMPLPEGHTMQTLLQMQMNSQGKALATLKGSAVKAKATAAKAAKSAPTEPTPK